MRSCPFFAQNTQLSYFFEKCPKTAKLPLKNTCFEDKNVKNHQNRADEHFRRKCLLQTLKPLWGHKGPYGGGFSSVRSSVVKIENILNLKENELILNENVTFCIDFT